MILPSLIVGNELLILAGVASAVGLWFFAHRHGQLRGLVDANKNRIDDPLETPVKGGRKIMNRSLNAHPQTGTGDRFLPACMDAVAAASYLGWPVYFMPLLARVGHLKPLGKPGQNARKWYAAVELERVGRDPVWLDRAIRIVDRLVREANGGKKGKRLECPLPGDASLN